MEPIREDGLADLINRLLDKGLVLNAELVITLGEVPLVGINLRALIAGMETMVAYGMMQTYDKAVSAQEPKQKDVAAPIQKEKTEMPA